MFSSLTICRHSNRTSSSMSSRLFPGPLEHRSLKQLYIENNTVKETVSRESVLTIAVDS